MEQGRPPPTETQPTCLVRAAENCLLLPAERPVPHPHGDGEGLLRVDGNHTIRDPYCLGAIELKDLVTVVAIISGEANGPVQGAAGGRKQLGSARSSP